MSFKSLWSTFTFATSAYIVYKQFQAAREAKDELYENLSPEMQLQWDEVFGKPVGSTVVNESTDIPAQAIVDGIAPALEQIVAGT